MHGPEDFAAGLAREIDALAASAARRAVLSEGARRRAETVGSWDRKLAWMVARYVEVIDAARAAEARHAVA